MREEFIESIKKHQSDFKLNLPEEKINALTDYYEFIQKHNEILHLVAPTSAADFALRHVLESLALLEFLPKKAKFADVGTGAGFPAIPCLIVRDDLRAILIESKIKKTKFLEEAVEKLTLVNRVLIVNKQFEEVERSNLFFVTCRALDKFTEKLPRLLRWSGKADLLFFGGISLGDALQEQNVKFRRKLLPLSERRFLFIAKN